jgi:hypothetical protein
MAANRLIDTQRLIPLQPDLWGSICSDCQLPQSNWQWLESSAVSTTICALCYLYKSEWGKAQSDFMESLLKDLEEGWSCKFLRSDEGKLKLIGDGNRVLATLAYLSRSIQLREKHQ